MLGQEVDDILEENEDDEEEEEDDDEIQESTCFDSISHPLSTLNWLVNVQCLC